jgi:hypothetical protein
MSSDSYLSGQGRFAALLIAIGIILGFDSFFNLHFLYRLWPLLITLLGVGFIGIFAQRGRRESVYMGIGIYCLGFSGLALYCSLISWTALATLWPLFIAFLGLSFLAAFIWGLRKRLRLLIGLLLLSTATVFYFVFTINPHLWWTVFVLGGASIMIAERAR